MTITTMHASVAITRAGHAHIAFLYPNVPDQLVIHVKEHHGGYLAYSTDPGVPTWPQRQTFAEALDDALACIAKEAAQWCSRT